MMPEANIFTTTSEALHVGFVLALRDAEVFAWDAGFVFGLWNQLQFLERHWPAIVSDIRCGRLSSALEITEQQRKTVDSLLTPDPDRAAELQSEFGRGFDGIISRVFPHLEKVTALSSGSSMDVYRERCKRYLGNLSTTSMVYGASEGLLGINFNKPSEPPSYALVPGINFIEFLPSGRIG